LRERHGEFVAAKALLFAIAATRTDDESFQSWDLPFPCLADADRSVFDKYGVQSRALSLGQRPAVFVVRTDGSVARSWLGKQQWQIPSVDEILRTVRVQRAG
jgi:peroxiredoxin